MIEFKKSKEMIKKYIQSLEREMTKRPDQIKKELSSIAETDAVRRLISTRDNTQLDEKTLKQDLNSIFEFMNCPYSERELKLGHTFFGFHYDNDLLSHLNKYHVVSSDGEPLKRRDVLDWNPAGWKRDKEHFETVSVKVLGLTYEGSHPSSALDELFRGPTVLDCGMAMQVALLMAIKKQIGNARFDIAFGKQPLHISQYLWNPCQTMDDLILLTSDNHTTDHALGNPFYAFLNTAAGSSIILKHYANSACYGPKQGGGKKTANYTGHNTWEIDGVFKTFDPNGAPSTDYEIRSALVNAHNLPPSSDVLKAHEQWKKDPDSVPEYAKGFEKVLDHLATHQIGLGDITLKPGLDLDLARINRFLSQSIGASHVALDPPVSSTYSLSKTDIPEEFYRHMPWENRGMDLWEFETGITQACQHKALGVAKQFIANVLSNKNCFYTLQGPAGIGKTAIAVATAKELAENGKKVLFLSEVGLSKLATGYSYGSIFEIHACIAKEIAGYDAVFMDDNNLTSLVGKTFERVVLERFFDDSKNLAVFKTSNLEATYECFKTQVSRLPNGKVLIKRTHPPSYTDSIWESVQKFRLEGESLRKGFDNSNVIKETDDETLLSFECDTQACNKAVVVKRSVGGDYTHVGYSESPQMYIPLTADLMEKPSFQLSYNGSSLRFDYLKEFVETLHDLNQKKLVLINKTNMSNDEMINEIRAKAEKDNDLRFLERFQILFGYDKRMESKPQQQEKVPLDGEVPRKRARSSEDLQKAERSWGNFHTRKQRMTKYTQEPISREMMEYIYEKAKGRSIAIVRMQNTLLQQVKNRKLNKVVSIQCSSRRRLARMHAYRLRRALARPALQTLSEQEDARPPSFDICFDKLLSSLKLINIELPSLSEWEDAEASSPALQRHLERIVRAPKEQPHRDDPPAQAAQTEIVAAKYRELPSLSEWKDARPPSFVFCFDKRLSSKLKNIEFLYHFSIFAQYFAGVVTRLSGWLIAVASMRVKQVVDINHRGAVACLNEKPFLFAQKALAAEETEEAPVLATKETRLIRRK